MSGRLLVIGGGFAGLWAAAAAARLREEAGGDLDIALLAPDPFHVIRVRCYETDIGPIRVPLDDVLGPIGVRRIEGRAERIEPTARRVTLGAGADSLAWDGLVLAAGSALAWPPVPGLAAHGFDVDSWEGASQLASHLASLSHRPAGEGRGTVVVLGAGLVGIELACEMPGRLRAQSGLEHEPIRVVLLERGPVVAADMGAGRPAILEALAAAGVEVLTNATLASVRPDAALLGSGDCLPAATVVCATGMRASPLAADLGRPLDRLGRVSVDAYLAVEGTERIYAAGDVASAAADAAGHRTVMSCQHARPMGRLAGHNAACDLLGRSDGRIAFSAPDYVTCLDLGPWGAIYTRGWDRGAVLASGAEAKRTKETINRLRIYPPPGGDRAAILAAAAPLIQARPAVGRAN